MVDEHYALISSHTGTNYLVRVMSTIDREKLKPNTSIAIHKNTQAVVDILPIETDANIQMMRMTEKPDVSYSDIGGLDQQKQ